MTSIRLNNLIKADDDPNRAVVAGSWWDESIGGMISRGEDTVNQGMKVAEGVAWKKIVRTVTGINDIGSDVMGFLSMIYDMIIPPDEAAKDPLACYRLLQAKNQANRDASQTKPLFRLWDKNMVFIARMENILEATWEELDRDSGSAHVVILRDNWLGNYLCSTVREMEDVHLTIDPDVHKRTWRTRWGGKITSINFKKNPDGYDSVEIQAVHNREHLKHLLIGCTPIFPPEVQPIKMWVLPGPCRSVISASLFVNLARIYFPVMNMISNVMNPLEWSSERLGNLIPMNWPIQISFVNPLLDQSRWTVLGSRWTDAHTVCDGLLKDAGCIIRAYTWLPEDEDSPQQELNAFANIFTNIGEALAILERLAGNAAQIPIKGADLLWDLFADHLTQDGWDGKIVIDEFGHIIGAVTDVATYMTRKVGTGLTRVVDLIGRPWRPAVILSVEDKSGVTGPTGTVVDGLVNLVAATLDDLVTETIFPLDLDGDGQTDPFFRALALVAPHKPKVVFRDLPYVGVIEAERIVNKCQAITAMVGGKSPGWVNDAQTFGITYGISKIQEIFYAGQYEDALAPNLMGSMGLDNLYQGQLDDTLLAYQRITDPVRALVVGDYSFRETFTTGSGTAWTLAAQLTLRQGLWKTRAYTNFKVDIVDGLPWYINKDFILGDRVAFELAGILYVDQCTAIRGSFSYEDTMKWQASIGNDEQQEDPVAAGMRLAAMAWNFIGMVVGSSDLF